MGPPRDDSLLHQVRLTTTNHKVFVSCNCRRTVPVSVNDKGGKLQWQPIGQTHDFDETKRLYNNPENHWAEFGEEDMLP